MKHTITRAKSLIDAATQSLELLAAHAARDTVGPIIVVMATHDNASTIVRALRSIDHALSGHEYSLVVADDASTDNTVGLIHECRMSAKTKLVRMFSKAHGVAAAKNRAVQLALQLKGSHAWVLFVDPDDELMCGALDTLVSMQHDGARFGVGSWVYSGMRGRRVMKADWSVNTLAFPPGASAISTDLLPDDGQYWALCPPGVHEDVLTHALMRHRGVEIRAYDGRPAYTYHHSGFGASGDDRTSAEMMARTKAYIGEVIGSSDQQPKRRRSAILIPSRGATDAETRQPAVKSNGTGLTAYHSGDRGDVIYALPLCRALGVTRLYLCPADYTRERMSPESARSLAALVASQPYIESCEYAETPPDGAINLNAWRALLGPEHAGKYFYHTLAGLHLRWFGFPESCADTRWICVAPSDIGGRRVVIARSSRYHSKEFDWKAVMEKYGKDAVFIGSISEHAAFAQEFGELPHHRTETLLDVAAAIAASDLFIGNQSCPYAIAEGMKHPAILEWCEGPSQNCHFVRTGLLYGTEHLPIPDLERKPSVNWVALSDLHSGFGRIAHAFYIRNRSVRMNWVPTRVGEEFTKFDKAISLSHERERCDSVVLESVPVIHQFLKRGDIAFTMWESDRLPGDALRALNECKAVIVPSEWCREVFADSGVKPTLYKVPLGVDGAMYRPPIVRKQNDVLTFGASTRFCADGNPRKNIHEIMVGFKAAFPHQRDVRLVVKGYDSDHQFKSDDPRISVIVDFWSEHDMVRWYQELDCFINLPRGGGWELHVHEAMMCGAVPIVLGYSSTLEFVDDRCGYLVKHRLIDADWHVYKGCGKWAFPDMDSYVSTLRYIYDHRGELDAKRVKAVRATEHLTWDNASDIMGRTLLNIL